MLPVSESFKIPNFQLTNLRDQFLDTVYKVVQKGLELIQKLITFVSATLTLMNRKEQVSIGTQTDVVKPEQIVNERDLNAVAVDEGRGPIVAQLEGVHPEGIGEDGEADQVEVDGGEVPIAVQLDDVEQIAEVALDGEKINAIEYLIKTTAEMNLGFLGKAALLLKIPKIKEERRKIKGLHPLQFLSEVFKKNAPRGHISSIFQKNEKRASFLTGSGALGEKISKVFPSTEEFTKGFADDMDAAVQEAVFQDHLKVFITSIYPKEEGRTKHESSLTEFVEKKDWEGFIKYLIANPSS